MAILYVQSDDSFDTYTVPTKKVGSMFFGNFSAQTWPNSKRKVSFENYRF